MACCGHKAQCLSLYLPLSLSLCLSPGLPLLFFIFLFLTGRSQNLPYPRVSSHNFGLETSVLRDAEGSRRNPKQIGWGLFFFFQGRLESGIGGLGVLFCLKPSLASTACRLQDPPGLEPTAPAWMSFLGVCAPLSGNLRAEVHICLCFLIAPRSLPAASPHLAPLNPIRFSSFFT